MKKLRRLIATVLAVVLCFGSLATGASAAVSAATAESSVSFAEEFANPTNNDYKPGIRYWFSPGRMTEAQTRKEIRNFANMGYGHVELISLEQTTVQMNSKEWNDVMYWILDEAVKVGIRIDVTLGEFWPIATEAIPKDEAYTSPAAEQKLSVGSVDFAASEGNMVYSEESFANPSYQTTGWRPQTVYAYDARYPFTLVAVTAAKKNADGTYDPDSAVVLTDLVNKETGAVSWTAPSEGNWSIFWAYQQNTGKILSFGVDATVVDHMSTQGTQAVIDDFEQGFDAYEEETGIDLRALYKAAGGDFFGDSFELSSCTMWTWDFLQEFQARRGYDLTPYLATIWNSGSYNDASAARTYEFDGIGEKVRNDYGLTVSELIAERHLAVFNEWAETLDMNLRYQVHSSSGALLIDETVGALATDTPETESYALGNSLDAYRSKSAAVTLMNSRYGAEAAAEGNMAWVQTWTGSTGTKTDHGLMYFTNRLFAGGVNELTLHGATYQLEGQLPDIVAGSFMPFPVPPFTVTFPGYSLMQGMNYPNDWANSTPLYTYSHEMLAYLARTQMVLQQGKADLDLAVYRLFTTPSVKEAGPSELNLAGYTYEYVTDTILKQDKAVVGQQDGQTVLAPEGAAYQALVIDQRHTSAGTEAFSMPVSTAKTILSYAKAGLPVFIVGEAPSASATLNDNDAELVSVMNELKTVATCVDTIDQLEAALRSKNVTPDADPAENNATMFYHREDGAVNYYFLANDSTEQAEELTVTLKGEGQPYVLDAWSGEITPVAEYTTSDGSVTLAVDLAPSEQALIAVAEDGWFGTVETVDHAVATDADELFFQNAELLAKTVSGGEHTVTLSNGETKTFTAAAPEAASIGSWSLVVHKWLPVDLDDNSVSPWQHQVIDSDTYAVANTDEALVGWAATDPDNLTKVMGVGDYTATITLEKGWAEGQGAYLTFNDVSDTMGLTVNGHKVPVNQIAKNTDIGPWLVAGENTIVVITTSAAGNYLDRAVQNYGIIGAVTLQTYTVSSVYENAVTLSLTGETDVTVDAGELTYTLTAANTNKLATATLTFTVEGNAASASVEGLNDWFVISQSYENGVLTAILGNNQGVSGAEAAGMAAVKIAATGKTGDVTVTLADAVLSSYNGPDNEAFTAYVLDNASVTTKVDYSVYDVNQDGTVNQLDITRAQRAYGAVPGDANWNARADVNHDGVVDINDLILVLNNYSK